jgi:hypothetical protein
MPVSPPLLLKNLIDESNPFYEAYFLVYDPPPTFCGAGATWLIRTSVAGSSFKLLETRKFPNVRATGFSLVGGRVDLAVTKVGTSGEKATAFTVLKNEVGSGSSGSAPYVESWREVR